MTKKIKDSKYSETARGPQVTRRGLFKGTATVAGATIAGGLAGGYIPNALTHKALAQGNRPIRSGSRRTAPALALLMAVGTNGRPKRRSS